MDEVEKKDKELLLLFFSKREKAYLKALEELGENKYHKDFMAYIDYLLRREDYMRLIEQDKEWAKRANWTLEEFVKHIVKHIDPAIRLTGLKPEIVLKHYKPEERLIGLKPEIVLKHYKPEERLIGLKPEERLIGLKPEVVLKHYKPEEIEAYLKKLKQNNRKDEK